MHSQIPQTKLTVVKRRRLLDLSVNSTLYVSCSGNWIVGVFLDGLLRRTPLDGQLYSFFFSASVSKVTYFSNLFNCNFPLKCVIHAVLLITIKSDLSSKGHSQLVHMRIRYHFLADLHITPHYKSRAEKRIL